MIYVEKVSKISTKVEFKILKNKKNQKLIFCLIKTSIANKFMKTLC
jgi:hypothetical protein